MVTTPAPLGLRVVGGVDETRVVVNAARAFAAYCRCDPAAGIEHEAYLSAFAYPADLARFVESQRGSTKGYAGPVAVPVVWFDLDGNLDSVLTDARALAAGLLCRYRSLDDDALLLFFSGRRGIHIGLPTGTATPAVGLNDVAKRFALRWGERARVTIDPLIYLPTQLFRAPNSTHGITGLRKRRLTFAELAGLTPARIVELAREPIPFDPPTMPPPDPKFLDDWHTIERATPPANDARAAARAATIERGRFSRATLDYLANGADIRERHRRLFRAAAECRDWEMPPRCVVALLSPRALDDGLPPKEVFATIEDAIASSDRKKGTTT